MVRLRLVYNLNNLYSLEESLDRIAKASSMRWYGHILRREDNNVLLKALHFELSGRTGKGRPKQTCKKQVQKKMHKNGLVMKEACDRENGERW